MISDQHHRRLLQIHGLKQLPGERDVHHRDLVDDQQVGFDRVEEVPGIVVAVEAKQTVDRTRFVTNDLLEPLGGLPRWRGQGYREFQLLGDRDHRRHRVGLAASRPAGHQRDLVREHIPHRLALIGVEERPLPVNELFDVPAFDPLRGGALQRRGQIALHPNHLRQADGEAFEDLLHENAFGDHRLQMALDDLPAIERIHDEHGFGAIEEVFILDPAVAVIEGLGDTCPQPGADARRQLFVRIQFSGNLVDSLEAESGHLPHKQIGIGFKQRYDLAAKLLDQRLHLKVGEFVGRQIGHGGVEVRIADPDPLEIADRLKRHLGDGGDPLGVRPDCLVELETKGRGDLLGLLRADAFDLRVVGQIVSQPLG